MAHIVGRKREKETWGPQLEAYQIVLRPLVSEKGMHLSTRHNAYPFEVNPLATKTQIKAAVEEMFNVRVAKVCTQNRIGKLKRFKGRPGRLSNWKKAIVTLAGEDRLEFF